MNWLQKRLDDIDYTHQDLQNALSDVGIERVRATITGWTNGKPIALLNNPAHARKLATALKWSMMEMLVAAGYGIDIPYELTDFIHEYKMASPIRKIMFMKNISFVSGFLSALSDEELDVSTESKQL